MRTLISRFSLVILASLVAPALAAPATRPSEIAPPLEKSGWTLTFHDEFDGSKLDENKWMDRYPYGRTHANQEQEYYAPDGYTISGPIETGTQPDKKGTFLYIARSVIRNVPFIPRGN